MTVAMASDSKATSVMVRTSAAVSRLRPGTQILPVPPPAASSPAPSPPTTSVASPPGEGAGASVASRGPAVTEDILGLQQLVEPGDSPGGPAAVGRFARLCR